MLHFCTTPCTTFSRERQAKDEWTCQTVASETRLAHAMGVNMKIALSQDHENVVREKSMFPDRPVARKALGEAALNVSQGNICVCSASGNKKTILLQWNLTESLSVPCKKGVTMKIVTP